jgi:thermospermine synthase
MLRFVALFLVVINILDVPDPAAVVAVSGDANISRLSQAQRRKTFKATGATAFEQIANHNKKQARQDEQQAREDAPGVIEAQRAKAGFRYVEDVAPGLKLDMDLHSILHTSRSAVQSIQVIDSYFGRTLVTDGKTQSAAHDEFVYHESLVHPPLFWCALLEGGRDAAEGGGVDATGKGFEGGAPKSVFIGGGGELATAREVLRHNSVARVVMVDIDPMVIDVCKK